MRYRTSNRHLAHGVLPRHGDCLLKKAEDEALADETLCGIANEKFIGHTAHEAIAATGGIQPQQVIAKERLFRREKLSDSPGSHGRRLVHVGRMTYGNIFAEASLRLRS